MFQIKSCSKICTQLKKEINFFNGQLLNCFYQKFSCHTIRIRMHLYLITKFSKIDDYQIQNTSNVRNKIGSEQNIKRFIKSMALSSVVKSKKGGGIFFFMEKE